MSRITDEHVEHWRKHGYVVVQLLGSDELDRIRENIARYMPTWEEFRAARHRYECLLGPSGLMSVRFPFVEDALNDFSVHPELLSLARTLLRTDDVALSHSQLVGKYAGTGSYEQELHCDYSNNTLAYPKRDDLIFDLPSITYYTDVTLALGPTHVVSQEHTRHWRSNPKRLSRDEFPDLYAHEVPVVVSAGSTLIYSMRTYHRGSAMVADEGARFSHHLGWHHGASRWAGQETFQHEGGRPEMDHFLERATPEQRHVVGFPPVGHEYWDDETLAGVAGRYPGMDMSPYRAAAHAGGGAMTHSPDSVST